MSVWCDGRSDGTFDSEGPGVPPGMSGGTRRFVVLWPRTLVVHDASCRTIDSRLPKTQRGAATTKGLVNQCQHSPLSCDNRLH